MSIKKGLLILGMQYDYMPSGLYPIKNSEKLITTINDIYSFFPFVFTTQDFWIDKSVDNILSYEKTLEKDSVRKTMCTSNLVNKYCLEGSLGFECINTLYRENTLASLKLPIVGSGNESRVEELTKISAIEFERILNKYKIEQLYICGLFTPASYKLIDYILDSEIIVNHLLDITIYQNGLNKQVFGKQLTYHTLLQEFQQ